MNCVELGTAKGTSGAIIVLLSNTKVTVCGSATAEGLSHVTLWPILTCICCGTNTANMSVEFPPPACTLIDVADVVALLLLLSNALMTLTLVVVVIRQQ